MTNELTHIDEAGHVQMVDIGAKPDTVRMAIASGEIIMKPETVKLIVESGLKKGNVLLTAQLAGIMAAKRTGELIPLCHTIPLTQISLDLKVDTKLPGVIITSTVKSTGKTGVEMEALTAVSIAALTVYDMAKAVEKTMTLQNIRLIEKHGGQSGDIVNE